MTTDNELLCIQVLGRMLNSGKEDADMREARRIYLNNGFVQRIREIIDPTNNDPFAQRVRLAMITEVLTS